MPAAGLVPGVDCAEPEVSFFLPFVKVYDTISAESEPVGRVTGSFEPEPSISGSVSFLPLATVCAIVFIETSFKNSYFGLGSYETECLG